METPSSITLVMSRVLAIWGSSSRSTVQKGLNATWILTFLVLRIVLLLLLILVLPSLEKMDRFLCRLFYHLGF